MDVFYSFGPTAIGMIAAVSIATYCWNRFRGASKAILIWFAFALVFSQFAFFPEIETSELDGLIRFMAFGTLAFGPAAVLIFMMLKVSRFKSAMARIPTQALLMTQSYRIGGVFLILAFVYGDLPAEIGLASGVMDVTVAVTAVALAFVIQTSKVVPYRLVVSWALLSLLDFGWATIIKFATFFGLIELSTPASMLGNPPLSIISLFALPLGIFVSVYIAMRALRELEHSRQPQ